MRFAKFAVPTFCLASSLVAFGQTARFDQLIDNTWEDPANWTATSGSPSLPPGVSDTAAFVGGTATLAGNKSIKNITVGTSVTTLQGLSSLRTISLDGTTTSSSTVILTLDRVLLSKPAGIGGGMNLTAGVTFANGGGIDWAGTGNFTPSTVLGDMNFNGSGTFTVQSGSTMALTGANKLTVASGVAFTSAGTISASQGTLDLASSSGSLSGAVTYGSANAATVRNSGTLSVGTLTVNTTAGNAGADAFQNTGTLTKSGSGALAFNNSAGGAYTLSNSGTMVLGGSGTVTFNVGLSQTAGTLSFAGAGVVLNQALSITGGSVIGSLSGATGSGAVNLTGATLSPGASAGAIGSIGVPAALSLNAGSTLAIDINGVATADAVTAGGAITLAGSPTLSVTAPSAIANSTAFTILSGSTLTGTFGGLANNATFFASGAANQQFRINYGGSSVTLTAVPEPATTAAVVGLGLLGFTAWRRSQKRA